MARRAADQPPQLGHGPIRIDSRATSVAEVDPRRSVDVATAVDEQGVAGEIAAGIARKEDRDRCDVAVRVTHAPIGLPASAAASSSGFCCMTRRNDADFGRADHVDGDAGRRPLAGSGAARRPQCLLAALLYSRVPMCALTPLSDAMLVMRPSLCFITVWAAFIAQSGPGNRCRDRPARARSLVLDPTDAASAPGVVDGTSSVPK